MSPLLFYGWSLSALKSRRTSLRADELNSVRGVGLPWVIRTYSGISSKGAYRAVSSGADDLETPQSECRPHGYFIAQREGRRYPHQRSIGGQGDHARPPDRRASQLLSGRSYRKR